MPRNRDLLGKQSGFQDPNYVDDRRDAFAIHGWDKCLNNYRDNKMVTPDGTPGAWPTANVTKFSITRQADELAHVYLIMQVGAIAMGGGSPTFKRFVDYALYHFIDHIDIYYETNDLKTITGDQLKNIYYTLDYDCEKRKVEQNRVGGGLTIGQRNALAAGNQTFKLDIPVDWINWVSENTHKYLKFCTLPQPMHIDVYLQPLAAVVESDGTIPTCTISSMQLECEWFYKPDRLRIIDSQIVNSQSPNPQFGQPGYVYKLDRLEGGSQQFGTGLTQLIVDLRNIRNPCYALIAIIRNAEDISTNLSNNFDALQPWTSYQLNDNADACTLTYTLDDQQNILTPRYWPNSLRGTNIIALPLCLSPKGNIDNANGELNIGRFNTPQLIINVPQTTKITQVDWWARTHNLEVLTQGNIFVRYK